MGALGPGADWTQRLLATGGGRNLLVVPHRRVVYASVSKNACTTLKWALAEIAGEDLTHLHGPREQVQTDTAIHRSSRHQHRRRLRDLPPALQAEIHPDNGWFIFGVARDPRARLFSARQDKCLLHRSLYRHWSEQPWYPALPAHGQDIIDSFATFVRALHSEPSGAGPRADRHFRPQVGPLGADLVPYTRIYDIRELGALRADLAAHLTTTGWTRPLQFRWSNATTLRPTSEVFAGGIRELVEEYYAADFAAYGAALDWEFATFEREPVWSPKAIADIRTLAIVSRKLSDTKAALELRTHQCREDRRTQQRLRRRIRTLQREVRRRRAGWVPGLSPTVVHLRRVAAKVRAQRRTPGRRS